MLFVCGSHQVIMCQSKIMFYCFYFRDIHQSSRLNLLYTKGINLKKNVNYECIFGMSDHVILKIEIKGGMEDKQ